MQSTQSVTKQRQSLLTRIFNSTFWIVLAVIVVLSIWRDSDYKRKEKERIAQDMPAFIDYQNCTKPLLQAIYSKWMKNCIDSVIRDNANGDERKRKCSDEEYLRDKSVEFEYSNEAKKCDYLMPPLKSK